MSFKRYWAGDASFAIGLSAGVTAVQLIAVTHWQLPSRDVSFVVAAQESAWLILGIPLGALLERATHRKRVLLTATIATTFLSLAVASLLPLNPPVVAVGLLAFLMSAAGVVFEIMSQSALPNLVDKKNLPTANSKVGATQTIAQLLGAPLVSFLIQRFSPLVAVVTQSVASLISALQSPLSLERPFLKKNPKEVIDLILFKKSTTV